MYLSSGDTANYQRWLARSASTTRARAKVIAELADFRLHHGDYQQAIELYRLALARGLDSTHVRELAEKYPQLKSVF